MSRIACGLVLWGFAALEGGRSKRRLNVLGQTGLLHQVHGLLRGGAGVRLGILRLEDQPGDSPQTGIVHHPQKAEFRGEALADLGHQIHRHQRIHAQVEKIRLPIQGAGIRVAEQGCHLAAQQPHQGCLPLLHRQLGQLGGDPRGGALAVFAACPMPRP